MIEDIRGHVPAAANDSSKVSATINHTAASRRQRQCFETDDDRAAAMAKKNKVAARREAHERLLERERQQKAKKEAKRLKFQARAPKKRSIPKGLVRGSSRNPEQYEEARRIVKLRKKAARTAPKKMDLEKSGTEKRRAAATEGRKSARQKVIDKRQSMEM